VNLCDDVSGLEVRNSMRRTEFTWEMPSCPFTQLLLICWVAVLLKCT